MRLQFVIGIAVSALTGAAAATFWSGGKPTTQMRDPADSPAMHAPAVKFLVPLRDDAPAESPEEPGATGARGDDGGVNVNPHHAEETLEEARQRAQRELQSLALRMDGEARDGRWASVTEADVKTTLQSVRNASFSVAEVACKTTLCRASVVFPSYSVAERDWQQLLHAKTPCATRVLLDEPNGTPGEFETQLYLDCEAVRASE